MVFPGSDIIEIKIFKLKISKAQKSTFLYLQNFLSKDGELIYAPHIFHDPSVKVCLPTSIKFDNSSLVYSLTNSIRSTIFNVNKFVDL